MKKPIRFIVAFVVVIVVIAGVNRAVQWFLHGDKDVAVERTNNNAQQPNNPLPTNESPKKNY